jgi:hypothetical protein
VDTVHYLESQPERNRSTANILLELVDNLQKLAKQEVVLAKAEVTAEYRRIRLFFYARVAYSISAVFALVLFTISLVHGLFAVHLPPWLVYAIAGALFSAATAIIYFKFEKSVNLEGTPNG